MAQRELRFLADLEGVKLRERESVLWGPGTCRACLAGSAARPEPLCTAGYCADCHQELRECATLHRREAERVMSPTGCPLCGARLTGPLLLRRRSGRGWERRCQCGGWIKTEVR